MSLLRLNIKQAKKSFFDPKKVMSATERASQRVLSKIGAFIMTSAKYSMRSPRGKKNKGASSKPGQPPNKHTGYLAKFLYFAYEPKTMSVVIGPALLNQVQSKGVAPLALEEGGFSTGKNRERVKIRKRPYMGPAYQANESKMDALWRNSVR
jgi:endo-1,4-beta-mannosidase